MSSFLRCCKHNIARSHLLLTVALLWTWTVRQLRLLQTCHAAIDRYCLPTRLTAANLLQAAAACEWDRQMDGQTDGHHTTTETLLHYASNVNKCSYQLLQWLTMAKQEPKIFESDIPCPDVARPNLT